MRWCTSKWTLDERKKGGGVITPRLSFHYPIFFTPSLTRKLHFLDNICRIFLLKWTGWNIHGDKLLYVSNVYTDCVQADPKVFQTSRCYFLNGSFYELANPLCLWISGKECVWFMGNFFCVYWSEMLCANCTCTADSRVQVCAIREYEPWYRVSKSFYIVFYEISIMLAINFTDLFTKLWYLFRI